MYLNKHEFGPESWQPTAKGCTHIMFEGLSNSEPAVMISCLEKFQCILET